MVKQVVAQGKCIREKSIVQIAVTIVHPFETKSSFNWLRLLSSAKLPVAIYAMMIIGKTISFAGKPNINAIRITPSSPIRRANGSKNPVQWLSRLMPSTLTLASSQIISPAGAATITARLSTKSVLSNSERTSIFPICGRLYGGSSRAKEEGYPFKIVLESIFDTNKVINMPNMIKLVNIAVDITELKDTATLPAKNMVIMAISVGNRPLHGTKLLVRIAISRSRGDSIIRHPITPHALHPKPMHIVKDCFPWEQAFLKNLSILNAIRGKYPKSSNRVNSGKKMAIGGSMTDTTHARVR